MDASLFQTMLVLLEKICVIIVLAYLITRLNIFNDLLEGKLNWKGKLLLAVIFGIVSIYGTYSGMSFFGAQANVRDLGPMIGGLVGGPFVGIGAGLIGGIQRYTMGGFTVNACSISTVLAGVLGGAIYLLNKKRFIGVWGTVLFAILMEGLHMALALILSTPWEQAVSVVSDVALPMIVANAAGAGIFGFIIGNLVHEKDTKKQRDAYREELERKRIELNIARDIQMSLLPEAVPSIKGFDIAALSIPAMEVGGDFYDFIALPDNRIGLTIADVSGKSVPAAMFMSLSRAALRASAVWSKSPAVVIKEANNLIAEDSKSGMFVTMFYAVLDPDRRTLTYVNAGHNMPILFDGESIVTLKPGGIALGAMEGAEYDEAFVGLKSGCTLALYTDGVTEAENAKGEQFGEERLYEIIRNNGGTSSQLVENIKRDVLTFCDGTPQFDDITLMILKVE